MGRLILSVVELAQISINRVKLKQNRLFSLCRPSRLFALIEYAALKALYNNVIYGNVDLALSSNMKYFNINWRR
jgi:hypothetical protein